MSIHGNGVGLVGLTRPNGSSAKPVWYVSEVEPNVGTCIFMEVS